MIRHDRLFAVVAVLVALVSLTGCADTKKLEAFLMQPRAPVSVSDYRVLPPDVISFRSIYVPEINGVSQQVRPDGKVNLPLLGEVYVAGNTPAEIEDVLKKRAATYYEKVDATVTVAGYNSQRVYVFGQVSRPGPQAWTGTNTLLDVLAVSQPTTLAWPEKIRVVRGQSPKRGGYLPKKAEGAAEPAAEEAEQQVGSEYEAWAKAQEKSSDEAQVIIVNMTKMIQKGDMSHNVLLQPDDVVYVRPNPLAAVGLAIQQVLFPIRPAVETVGVPAQAAGAAVIP